jgi:nucleotide-binding universal stress UspA family protein
VLAESDRTTRKEHAMIPKRILVPTDFGESSDAALAYASDLAKAVGAEVIVLHSYEIPTIGFPDGAIVATAELASRVREGAQAGLDAAVRRNENEGVPVRAVVKEGDASRTIVEAADELGAELIVMGTHGRRGLPRALLGSVAERVVRTATCPVLTVHADAA